MEQFAREIPNGQELQYVLADGDAWLSQRAIAQLFGSTTQNISMMLSDIGKRFDMRSAKRVFPISQAEGSRIVTRNVAHLSLEIVHQIALRSQAWQELNWIVELSRSHEIDLEGYRVLPVKEAVFGEMLEGLMAGIERVMKQFPVEGYFIDFYLPRLNVAVEYDESHHTKSSSTKGDTQREHDIRAAIPGITFIRAPEGNEIEALNRLFLMIIDSRRSAQRESSQGLSRAGDRETP